jgi:hypothetical protein
VAETMAEGFEPYSAALERSLNALSPGKMHLYHSLQITVTVLRVCSRLSVPGVC